MFHDIAASDEIVCPVRTTFTRIHIKFGDTEAPAKIIEDAPRVTSPRRSRLWLVGTTSKVSKLRLISYPYGPYMHLCHRFDLGTHQKKTNTSKLILNNDARNNFEFASFWEDP